MIKSKFRAILSGVLAACVFASAAAPGYALAAEDADTAVSLTGAPRSALVNWVSNLSSDVGRWNKPWDKDTYSGYTLILPYDAENFYLTPEVYDAENMPTLKLFEKEGETWQQSFELTHGTASPPLSIPQGERREYRLEITPSSSTNVKFYTFTCYRSTVRMQLEIDQPQVDTEGKNRVSVRLVADVAAAKAFHLGSMELHFAFPADRLQMDNGSGANQYGVWNSQITSKMKPQRTPTLNNQTGNYAISLIANRLSTGGGGVEDVRFDAGPNILATFSFVVNDGVLFDPGDIQVSALHYSDGINANVVSVRNIQDDTTGSFFEIIKTSAPVIHNLVPQGLDGSNSELIRHTSGGGQGFTSSCTSYTLNFTGGMQTLTFTAAYDDVTQTLVAERVDKQGGVTPVNGGANIASGETIQIANPADGETIVFRTAAQATPGNRTAYRVNLALMDIKLNYQQPELDGAFYKIPITVGQDTKLAGVHFRLIVPWTAQFEKSESASNAFYIIAQEYGVTDDGRRYIDIDLLSANSDYIEMAANELLFTIYVSVPVGSPAPACELTNVIVLMEDADVPAKVTKTKSMTLPVSTWNPNDAIVVTVYPGTKNEQGTIIYNGTPMYTGTITDHPASATSAARFEQQITFQVPADQDFKVELSKARHLTYTLISGTAVTDVLVLPCGDVNEDGSISQADRNLFLTVLAGGTSATDALLIKYDLDGDGRLSQADLNILSMSENFNKRAQGTPQKSTLPTP